VAVRTEAEVLNSLTCVLGSTQEESIGASRSTQGELVQSQSLTTSLLNSGSGGSGKAESSDRQLGDVEEAVVVSNGSNDHNSLSLLSVGNVGDNARDGHWRAVDSGHEQSAKNNFVEVGLGAAGEEAVELHQHLQVDVVALGRLAMGAAHMVTVQVDTHDC